MKKIVCFVLTAVLCVGGMSMMTGCTKRSEQLKLYSQGEYMDEELFEEFEAWYSEQTGEKVKVTMNDFQSNEDMYTMISMDKADYDLICPSDYMVEKMIKEGLCQKIDKEFVDITESIAPEYVEVTKKFDPTLEYSVPYMFGTFGIMYNYKTLGKHVSSWKELFEGNTDKTVSLKRSQRDTYHATSLYLAGENLRNLTGADKNAAVQAVFDDASDANIAAVKSTLMSWKSAGKRVWDDENGKFAMATGKQDMGLFWSCAAGYVMNDYEDDSGNIATGNKDLWYVIPEEGGNVYLDSFIISKYAVNTKAANYFLQFLCTKAAAIANSLYCGAISPVKEAYDQLKADIESDDEMFAGTEEGWKEMYIDMLFPPADALNRCGQMLDYGANEGKVLRAMTDVLR